MDGEVLRDDQWGMPEALRARWAQRQAVRAVMGAGSSMRCCGWPGLVCVGVIFQKTASVAIRQSNDAIIDGS